jgi:hypothetical protein
MTDQENAMETLIELTEADLDQIVGGTGIAAFSLLANTANGKTFASVFAAVAQAVTPVSASQAALVTATAA